MMFYDAHLHCQCQESGGFIVGLEGEPHFDRTLNNDGALKLHCPEKNYIAFYYVGKSQMDDDIAHSYLKYHPRREGYMPEMVMKSIARNHPRCVMIDTLNEPMWQPYDYWRIARMFPSVPFIFAHSGGYLINDFIKICHFQKNVWIDFALTHTILGHFNDPVKGLSYVNDAIAYSLESPFKDRILMSSDYPFFSQKDVVSYYKDKIELLNNNFVQLFRLISKKGNAR